MVRPGLIFILTLGFAMPGAAQSNGSRLPENTIDCKQFKKTGAQEWAEVETAVFDLGKIRDINLTNQPVKPRYFKFGGIDLYPVLEGKCGVPIYFEQGKNDQAKGDYDSALANFNQVILLDPSNAEAFDRRGEVYSSKGDYARAIADYNEALRLDLRLESAANHRTIAAEKLAQSAHPDTPEESPVKLQAAVAGPEKVPGSEEKELASANIPSQANGDQGALLTKEGNASPESQPESKPCRSTQTQGCKVRRRHSATRRRSFYNDLVRMFRVRRD